MPTIPTKQKMTIRLAPELIEASREAVRLGIATSPSDFVEEAVRLRTREVRHARLRVLAQAAMSDQDFVADMRDTLQAFQHADTNPVPEPS